MSPTEPDKMVPMDSPRTQAEPNGIDPTRRLSQQSFGWRVFEFTAIVLAVLVIASVLWFAIDVLLLLFAAILLATVVRAPAEQLIRLGVPSRLAVTIVALTLLALLGGLGVVLVPEAAAQIPQLVDSLASSIKQYQRSIGLDSWAESLAQDVDLQDALPSPAGLIGGATGIISSTFGALANVVILLVIGIYLAANPTLYVDGTTRLVPPQKRARVRETLVVLGQTLRWWLIGQLISMTVVATLTYLVLTVLGVPLALLLAVITFLLTFVPFLGPIVAAVPVLLVAFSQDAGVGLLTLVLYTLIQSFEGYVLTPLVQRQTVSLPPALTIAAQVLLGVLVGAMGIVLATPLAAAGMVATRMLYVEAVLGEPADQPIPEAAEDREDAAEVPSREDA